MKAATPRDPRHNATCPGCGEPAVVPFVFGMTAAEMECGRCKLHFMAMGTKKRLTYYALPSKARLAPWVGEPLPGDAR